MALPRRLYPKEFKINAVHLVQVEGRRACGVADELGIGRQTLYSWLHERGPYWRSVRNVRKRPRNHSSGSRNYSTEV